MRPILAMLLLTACSLGESTRCDPPGTQVASPRAAGCIAVGQGKLLLVKDRSGRWSIPAGALEPGETTELAAVRETLEEAGVVALAGPPVCAVPANAFVAHACVVRDPSGTRPDGTETTDARWMSRDEVVQLQASELRFPDQRPAYLQMLDVASRAEQRVIGGEPPPPAPGTP